MKVAIIGAGPSGLISLKYAIEDGHECDVFEQTGSIGGTWVYTDLTDLDENGVPVHSAMYQNLLTNLPKEVMTISNFSYPELNKSYLTQPEVLTYFNHFADHFNLTQYIKFFKYVTKVHPAPNNRWNVTFLDAKSKNEESRIYDAVLVCSGHFRDSLIPKIPDANLFQGEQFHSHKYRKPDQLKGKNVLIIGAGPSGIDISLKVAEVAKTVFLSYKKKKWELEKLSNLIEKPEVAKFQTNGARFVDGSEEIFDAVIYCTGYNYSYPFLSRDSGITITDNYVHPLYKHIVNSEYPTMYFMGIPFQVIVIPMLDLQARFIVASLSEKFTMPSKADMLKELAEAELKRQELGILKRHSHMMEDCRAQAEYYESISELAGIKNFPPVLLKIHDDVKQSKRNTKFLYKIIDDDTFVKETFE